MVEDEVVVAIAAVVVKTLVMVVALVAADGAVVDRCIEESLFLTSGGMPISRPGLPGWALELCKRRHCGFGR